MVDRSSRSISMDWEEIETPQSTKAKSYTIYTGLVFNSRKRRFDRDLAFEVDTITGLISSVAKVPSDPIVGSNDVDLRAYTVIPGLVDSHTHIFLHAYSETSSLNQMVSESMVERIVRATNHCRLALKAGYTTYRDLGTEGVFDADIGLRDSINRGLIPGPRLYVTTEALATSGGYAVRYESRLGGTQVPRISDPCDGVDGVVAAVRRRLGAGADIIKFYADYRRRTLRFPQQSWKGALPIQFPPTEGQTIYPSNPVSILFSQEEMNAIVIEARRAGAPVAAHAIEPEAVIMAAKAGVTTIEHGNWPSNAALDAMKTANVIFVPTLSIMEAEMKDALPEECKKILANVKKAFDKGLGLACGGDTGAFAHGENIRELELFVESGIPLVDTLKAATLTGWEACGGDLCGRRFGSLEVGWAADFVALRGDPRQDIAALRNVETVIKDGKIWVEQGRIVD